jgi:hypothetical protein
MALAAVHYLAGKQGAEPAANFRAAVALQKSAVRRLEALAAADPSHAEWARSLDQARKILDVQEMVLAGATAPTGVPGLADPQYLQVCRQAIAKARVKFRAAPTAANSEDFALSCLTLVAELRKGDYRPYRDEARCLLQECRAALKRVTDDSDRMAPLADEIDQRLKEIGAR